MRRTRIVKIDYGTKETNRDFGKEFLLTEMPCEQAELWADRAILAIGRSGAKIDHLEGAGMAGIFLLGGMKALFGVEEKAALELGAEMFACIQRVMPAATRPLVSDDIEEVQTRWLLRQEVLALHLGFSLAELHSTLSSAMKQAILRITQTFPDQSVKSSPRVKPRSKSSKPITRSKTSTRSSK